MALCDSHSGSHWLLPPLSGLLWPSLAHYCSLISLIQSLIGSQGPCSALSAAATLMHFLPLCTLGTKAGTLNTRFSRNQFNLMNQKFLTTADVPEDVTLCERSCSSPQQRGRTRIFQVPLPNCLSDKKCKCIRDSVKCNSRCHKNCSCQNHDNALIK